MFHLSPLEFWKMLGRIGNAGGVKILKCLVHLQEAKLLINSVFMFLFGSQAWVVHFTDWFTWMLLHNEYLYPSDLVSRWILLGKLHSILSLLRHMQWVKKVKLHPFFLSRTRSEVNFHLEWRRWWAWPTQQACSILMCKIHGLV